MVRNARGKVSMKVTELIRLLEKAVQEQGDGGVSAVVEHPETGVMGVTEDIEVISEAGMITLYGGDLAVEEKIPGRRPERLPQA